MATNAFDQNKKFEYHVEEDHVFDEKGSTFLAMRKIAWGVAQNEEVDPEKLHWELRKWRMIDGEEMANKGFGFLTEEGPHELTKTLLEQGFGHTKDVLNAIKDRDDFREAVENMSVDSDTSGEYFDPRSMLLEEVG